MKKNFEEFIKNRSELPDNVDVLKDMVMSTSHMLTSANHMLVSANQEIKILTENQEHYKSTLTILKRFQYGQRSELLKKNG